MQKQWIVSLLICASIWAPYAVAKSVNGVGRGKRQPYVTREETSEERQDRLDREKQMEDDLAAYMERWKADHNAASYTAIAYSNKTYRWGFSWGQDTEARANLEAKKRCGPGAEVLCWSKGTWFCALADGPRSYGAAPGDTSTKAKAEAIRLASRIAPGARIVLVVGGNPATITQSK
ncbi:MAG: DUF4189 domain-containing protein [Candidatus Obscuribacterales bacterium]